MSRHRKFRSARYEEDYDDESYLEEEEGDELYNEQYEENPNYDYKADGNDLNNRAVESVKKTDKKDEDKARLVSCLNELQKHIDDAVPKRQLIDIILKHNYDFEASLNDALICATSNGENTSPTDETVKEAKLISCVEELQKHVGTTISEDVLTEIAANNNFDFESALKQALNLATGTNVDVLTRKIGSLKTESEKSPKSVLKHPKITSVSKKLESISQIDSNEMIAVSRSSDGGKLKESTPVQSKLRKVPVDKKPKLYIVIAGHVDAGKSTLMGHLLFQLGEVNKKLMHKYEQESKKIGKQSFHYAWVFDETNEERSRGVTMDVGHRKFDLKDKIVIVLDAPGHRDFIPNMITGVTHADAAMLVVDATPGEFETGFGPGGQTREHALLIRSLGVGRMIVVVNKMDAVSWNKERFDSICNELRPFLLKISFRENDLTFVPCSGLRGDNLTTALEPGHVGKNWYKGDSLFHTIEKLPVPERSTSSAFRMSIGDVFRGSSGTLCVAGRIDSGILYNGDRVMIQPCQQIAFVKALSVDDQPETVVIAGESANVTLNHDVPNVAVGHVLCDVNNPVPVTEKVETKIIVFNIIFPLTVGSTVMMHTQNSVCMATVVKLVATLNKSTGEVLKCKPRMLTKNCSALVVLKLDRPTCLELYKDVKELGRIMLRLDGVTIAAGMITKIY